MRIAVIAPPFIPVPPARYGGTELFIGQLASGLSKLGHHVVVYANGASRLSCCEVRWLYPDMEWPLPTESYGTLKSLDHASWAVHDARDDCDVLHLNDALAIPFTRFVTLPAASTLHHPHQSTLSRFYDRYPEITYVCISHSQLRRETMARRVVIYHGIDPDEYQLVERKQAYLSFLGRIAPVKGTHLAIEVARRAGIPLKIAGEIQPIFRDYWETRIKPQVDGRFIEYLGEADRAMKNELLANSMALLFPIQWDEPFGLVMIEAMACGTPVLAFPGGSVTEIVKDGRSGWVCGDIDEMVRRLETLSLSPAACRAYVAEHFSLDLMARRYVALYRAMLEGAVQGGSTAEDCAAEARGPEVRA